MPTLRRLAKRLPVRAAGMAALLLTAAARPAAAQAVVGRVVDFETGTAVPGALVSVTGTGQREPRRTTAGDDGRYSLALPGAGTFRVQAGRTGYAAARSRPVQVGPHDTVRVDVRLPPQPVPLRPVTATSRPRRLPVRGKFVQTGVVQPPSVEVGPRRIVARGTFVAPSGCYQLAGVADRLRQVVTLYVDARPSGDPCIPAATAFTYTVTVRGLPPGSYTFRILHTYRDRALEPALAMDTTLAVPARAAPGP